MRCGWLCDNSWQMRAQPHSPVGHLQVKVVPSQESGVVQVMPRDGVAGQHCCSGSMQVVPHATVPASMQGQGRVVYWEEAQAGGLTQPAWGGM